MKKMSLIIAALVGSLVAMASPVQAQIAPGGSTGGHSMAGSNPQSRGPILGRSPEDRIMVMGEAEAIDVRRSPPLPAREHRPEDLNTEFTYTEWVKLSERNGWPNPDQTFQARRQSNYQMCRETTLFILLWSDLEQRYVALQPALGEMFPRVLGLRKNIIQAAQISTGASLLQPIIGAVAFTPAYGLLNVPSAVSNIAQVGAHANQALDNRDATLINLGITGINLEAQILAARGNVRYYEMMGNYCTEFLSASQI